MYNGHMNEHYFTSEPDGAASRKDRAARREAERRGKRLTLALCAALTLALLCALFAFLRGSGEGRPIRDTSVPAAAATATETAALTPAPSATPAPTETPQPSPTPLDGGFDRRCKARSPQAQMPADVPTLETEDELTQTTILISAVGDCTLGGDVGSSNGGRFSQYADEYGLDYFFANVRDIFAGDDFTVVNLEGPLTTQTSKRSGRQFNFRGSPEYAQILSGSSVEVCTLANNHALDFKQAGLQRHRRQRP